MILDLMEVLIRNVLTLIWLKTLEVVDMILHKMMHTSQEVHLI